MTTITVADFANELKRPADALLEQLQAAGVGEVGVRRPDRQRQAAVAELPAGQPWHGRGAQEDHADQEDPPARSSRPTPPARPAPSRSRCARSAPSSQAQADEHAPSAAEHEPAAAPAPAPVPEPVATAPVIDAAGGAARTKRADRLSCCVARKKTPPSGAVNASSRSVSRPRRGPRNRAACRANDGSAPQPWSPRRRCRRRNKPTSCPSPRRPPRPRRPRCPAPKTKRAGPRARKIAARHWPS